eukprot:5445965-Amphidinium_carterae.1
MSLPERRPQQRQLATQFHRVARFQACLHVPTSLLGEFSRPDMPPHPWSLVTEVAFNRCPRGCPRCPKVPPGWGKHCP